MNMKARSSRLWWICLFSSCLTVTASTDQAGRPAVASDEPDLSAPPVTDNYGALLSTHFNNLDQLKSIAEITYRHDPLDSIQKQSGKAAVWITCGKGSQRVTSYLESGITEDDFLRAKRGSIFSKLAVAMQCPFAATHRSALWCIENLGRRRPWDFGKGDVAFYDLAEMIVSHICAEDVGRIPPIDMTEKGYLNTFNHITAQAFMTSMFSEATADFVADVHERHNLPELVTGRFTKAQLEDPAEGPVDNYVDMLNNEWGQSLGLTLQSKYGITPDTFWTPELLTAYLNDIQAYYSWTLRIGFTPFRPTDKLLIRFAQKINMLTGQEMIPPGLP